MCKLPLKDIASVFAITALSAVMLSSSVVIFTRLGLKPDSKQGLDGTSLERLTGLVVGLLGIIVLLWLVLSAVIAVAATLSIRTGHHRIGQTLTSLSPAFLLRLTVGIIGGSIAFAPSAQAAAPVPSANTALQQSEDNLRSSPEVANRAFHDAPLQSAIEQTELLSPGWVPQPITIPLQRVAGGSPHGSEQEVIVQAGDSLWSIAAAHLDAGASTARIAAAWPRWYAANKKLIGPNPDQLALGLVLQAPTDATITH